MIRADAHLFKGIRVDSVRDSRTFAILTFAGMLLFVSACQTASTGITAPPASFAAGHYLGTPLSGPQTGEIPAVKPADALSIRVTFVALEKMPSAALDPLGAHARLVTATRGGMPVLPSSGLTLASRYSALTGPEEFWSRVRGSDYVRSVILASNRSALPPGVTATFRTADTRQVVDPVTGRQVTRFVEIAIHRPVPLAPATMPATLPATAPSTEPATAPAGELATAPASEPATTPATAASTEAASEPATAPAIVPEQLDVSLIVEDLVFPAAPPVLIADEPAAGNRSGTRTRRRAAPAAPAGPPAWQHETAGIDIPVFTGSQHFAVIIPFAFPGTTTHGLVAFVDIGPGDDSGQQSEAMARCVADLEKSQADLTTPPPLKTSAAWSGIRTALDSLSRPAVRRAALVYLGSETSATLCSDTALVIDETNLATLAQAVRQAAATNPAPASPEELGQRADLQTFRLLCTLQASAKIPSELAAVLSAYAGEPARHSGSLEEIQRGLATRSQLDTRLIAENMIFLEDSAPAARVRAYDWLNSHGKAPPDYDPLAPPRARRTALEKFLNPQPATAPATLPATGGNP